MFLHFLPGGENAAEMQSAFNVEALADQLADAGVDYFGLTVYQNSGWFNAPNDEYNRTTGYKPGERCSDRDIPMELADALAKRKIKLFLYVTGQVPNQDARAQKAFGIQEGPADQKITLEFARKWAAVFREWSLRYGDKVFGWWVDGCYSWCDFNNSIGEIYREALRAGNPNAVVAFNPGVRRPEWESSDYTAGEINDPFDESAPSSQNEAGQKSHALTFLGTFWGGADSRYTTDEWLAWAPGEIAKGMALTLDSGLVYNPGEMKGYFPAANLDTVRAISRKINGKTCEHPADNADDKDHEREAQKVP